MPSSKYAIPDITDACLQARASSCPPFVIRRAKIRYACRRRRPRRVAKRIKARGNAVRYRDAYRIYGPPRGMWETLPPDDLRGVSFLWDPTFVRRATAVEPFATSRCLHTFGHYGTFKPSIAEVMAQMPDEAEGACGFTIAGPKTADDLNREIDALKAGYQVSEITWYRPSGKGPRT
jgi:hypothetical protein